MLALLRVYIVLTRLIGMNNLGYDSKRQRFTLHHRPSIIYSLLLNLATIALLLPAAHYTMEELRAHERLNLAIAINYVIAVISVITFLCTMCSRWARRAAVCRMINGYVRLLRQHLGATTRLKKRASQEIRAQMWQLLMAKGCVVACRLVGFYIFLYGRTEHVRSHDFVLSSLLLGLVHTMILCVDFNIFLGLVMHHMLLQCLLQHLADIARDFNWLQLLQTSARHHTVWRQLLMRSIAKLSLRQRRLRLLLAALMHKNRIQLTIMLLCEFLTHIASFFELLRYFGAEHHFRLPYFLLNLFVMLASVCNLWLLFDVSERVLQRVAEMRQLLGNMLQLCGNPVAGGNEDSSDNIELKRSIESLLLELQLHDVRINVLGLFDLRCRSAHNLNQALVMHIILLVQIAFKDL